MEGMVHLIQLQVQLFITQAEELVDVIVVLTEVEAKVVVEMVIQEIQAPKH